MEEVLLSSFSLDLCFFFYLFFFISQGRCVTRAMRKLRSHVTRRASIHFFCSTIEDSTASTYIFQKRVARALQMNDGFISRKRDDLLSYTMFLSLTSHAVDCTTRVNNLSLTHSLSHRQNSYSIGDNEYHWSEDEKKYLTTTNYANRKCSSSFGEWVDSLGGRFLRSCGFGLRWFLRCCGFLRCGCFGLLRRRRFLRGRRFLRAGWFRSTGFGFRFD